MEDEVISAANEAAKKTGIRVLVRAGNPHEEHLATYIDSDGCAHEIGKLSKTFLQSQAFQDAIAAVQERSGRTPPASSILVCTHGARDCRCGDIGGDLVTALKAEVGRRKSTVEIGELGHVGGHK